MATRLLLSDDSITIQKVVELVLAEEGFEIKPTNNGEEAFQSLDSFAPDIVLADIEMPKMNGYQLCEKIKKDPRTANVPVILMAPAFEPIDEELAKKVGASDYIIKPFESQELLNKINGALAAGGIPVKASKAEEPETETVAVAEPAEAVVAEDPWADLGTTEDAQPVQAEADADGAFVIPEEEVPAEAIATEETAQIQEAPEKIPDNAAPFSEGDIKDSVRVSVSRIVVDSIKKMDMKEVVLAALMPEMKPLMEDIIRKSAPKIIEGLVKEVMKEVSDQVRKDIEKIIWEIVPDLAESIIKKEIDSIKSEV